MMKIIVSAWVCFTMVGCGFNSSPGSGEKVGQIVRLNQQGLVNQTWEGSLIRGGIVNGSGSVGGASFDFTVSDDATAKRVQELMTNQTEVLIKYNMEFIYSQLSTDSSGHFLTSIEPTPSAQQKN